jgi:outer membrane protein TolC
MKVLNRTIMVAAIAALPFAPRAASAQEPERVITLEEAVQLALRNSPVMVQREGAVATAESAERTTGLGAWLPSLSFSSGASLSSTSRFNPQTNTEVTGSSDSYNARLSSNMDLFTGFRRGAERSQSLANTAAAEASLVQQRFQVALSAKQIFFNVLRAEETIRSFEAALERATQGLRAAEQRLAVGSATRSDSLRAQLETMQARQSLLSAQNQRRASAYALGALVGFDGPVFADPSTAAEPRPLTLADDELIQLAVSASPAVMTAEASVRANESAITVARAQYMPTLGASAGYTWNNDNLTINGGRTSWSTSLSLSYPLFNGFTREDSNERARVNVRNARATAEDAKRQARANVRSAIDDLRLAEQQIVIAREAVVVAQEDLRVQQTRYSLGASTILDQIASQAAVVGAELNLIGARYDYLVARAQLEALVGREL